jgi:hypothetical protein
VPLPLKSIFSSIFSPLPGFHRNYLIHETTKIGPGCLCVFSWNLEVKHWRWLSACITLILCKAICF